MLAFGLVAIVFCVSRIVNGASRRVQSSDHGGCNSLDRMQGHLVVLRSVDLTEDHAPLALLRATSQMSQSS